MAEGITIIVAIASIMLAAILYVTARLSKADGPSASARPNSPARVTHRCTTQLTASGDCNDFTGEGMTACGAERRADGGISGARCEEPCAWIMGKAGHGEPPWRNDADGTRRDPTRPDDAVTVISRRTLDASSLRMPAEGGQAPGSADAAAAGTRSPAYDATCDSCRLLGRACARHRAEAARRAAAPTAEEIPR